MTDQKNTNAGDDLDLVREVEREDPVPAPEAVIDPSDVPHADPGDTAPPHGDPMRAA